MGKVLGLDVGDATIGIAISDALLFTAQGRETIRRTTIKDDIDLLVNYVVEENIDCIVIGMPKNMNGTIGPQGEKTEVFKKKLEKKITYSERTKDLEIKFVFWDERLTSVAANKAMIEGDLSRKKRKKIVDKIAAVYILQGYLESLR